jgi:hypothetical protein
MKPGQAVGLLILAGALARLAWAAVLGPGNDEAYHALFVNHPDWSYYDHPPMLALVERVGLLVLGRDSGILGVRLGFIGLFAGSTLLMYRLAARWFGASAGWLAAVVLNATAYYGVAASSFALPDGPLLFFWLLTLDRLAAAVENPRALGGWILVGLAWGCALLSKYHAVFLPAGFGLYLLWEPSARPILRRAGPYLAAAIGLALFSPVLYWNARHGWASFAFQGNRALGVSFRPDRLAGFLGGQVAYLLPWIWFFLVAAAVRRARSQSAGAAIEQPERFLLAQAVGPLAAFLAVACVAPVLPHWSLVGFLPLMPLLGRDWAALAVVRPHWMRARIAFLLGFPIVGAAVFLSQARWGWIPSGEQGSLQILPVSRDPTADTIGWDAVAAELRRRGLVDQPGTFLFTSKWYQSGQLAFALGLDARTPVLCYGSEGRAHGFGLWSRPDDWLGRDGVLVVANHSSTEPQAFERYFERIEPLGGFTLKRQGHDLRRVRLYRCRRQVQPFPFAIGGEEIPVNTASQIANRRPQAGGLPLH